MHALREVERCGGAAWLWDDHRSQKTERNFQTVHFVAVVAAKWFPGERLTAFVLPTTYITDKFVVILENPYRLYNTNNLYYRHNGNGPPLPRIGAVCVLPGPHILLGGVDGGRCTFRGSIEVPPLA